MPKGVDDERRLVRHLWKYGFAVVRSPASGASTKMPRPDILAGSREKGIQLAIEVKTTRKKCLYISNKSIHQLISFARQFGCQPVVAVKFKGRKTLWRFVRPEYLTKTPLGNYKITFERALQKGVTIKSLMKGTEQG